MQVKVVDGIGTTIDVILSNGYLHVNDTIVVCGLSGPIVTTIRALLTPFPMTELRVKGEYQRLKSVKAAAGIKVGVPLDDDDPGWSDQRVCLSRSPRPASRTPSPARSCWCAARATTSTT